MADKMMYGNDYWQEQLDEVMDNFDFQKVAEVMRFLEWEWAALGHVPDVPDLRREVRAQVRNLLASGRGAFISGGFTILIDYNEGCLSVRFTLEEWDAYGETPTEAA